MAYLFLMGFSPCFSVVKSSPNLFRYSFFVFFCFMLTLCVMYCGNYILFLLEFLFLLLFCGVALDPAPDPGPGTALPDTGVADPDLTPAVDDQDPALDPARLIIRHGDTGPATRSQPDLMVLPLASHQEFVLN